MSRSPSLIRRIWRVRWPAIEGAGGQSLGVALDLKSNESIAAAAASTLEHLGRIDLLVNNAAMLLAKPALDVAADEFEAVMRINVTGTYMMTQHVARHLIEEGRPGQIINIASTFTTVGAVNVSPYGISKAAIGGLVRHLAAEWAPHDIRVNAVAPGTSMTKLRAEIFDNDQARRNAGLSKIPLGRFTEPADIAGGGVLSGKPGRSLCDRTCAGGRWRDDRDVIQAFTGSYAIIASGTLPPA